MYQHNNDDESAVYPIPLVTNEFSGAANIFITKDDYKVVTDMKGQYLTSSLVENCLKEDKVHLDLIINSCTFSYADHHKLDEHLGDIFTVSYFGKAPITLNISGYLMEYPRTNAKAYLMELYTKLFRITKVAKHKIVPNIQFVGFVAQGAMLSLTITENSAIQDAIAFNMQFLVFNMYGRNYDSKGRVSTVDIIYNEKSRLVSSDIKRAID